jgi:hypothetical protein
MKIIFGGGNDSMKQNQLRVTVIGLMVAVICFVTYPSSSLAVLSDSDVIPGGGPGISVDGSQNSLWQNTKATLDRINADPRYANDPQVAAINTCFILNCAPLSTIQGWAFPFLQPGPIAINPSSTSPPFSGPNIPGRAEDDSSSIPYNFGKSFIIKDPSNLDTISLDDYDQLLIAAWDKINALMAAQEKEMNAIFSAEWEDQERISKVLDQQWQDKINELIKGIQNHGAVINGDESVVVLDAVDFTLQIQAIDRLLNPPARLHPWLKWLLYLHRVSPEMLQFYQAALEGRDRIYTLASKSEGRLKIRYQGRIMDVPIFVWPDNAEGSYELVMVRDQHSLTSSHSSTPVAQAASALPSQ